MPLGPENWQLLDRKSLRAHLPAWEVIVLGCTFKTTAGDSVLLSMAKPKANAFLRKNRELGRGRSATLYPGSGPVALVGERPAWSLSRRRMVGADNSSPGVWSVVQLDPSHQELCPGRKPKPEFLRP